MPKYEFYVSVSYTQLVTIEAEDREKAFDLACETRDADIIDNGDHGFDCVFDREITDEPV
jgi:hypothetical protein